MNNIYSISVFLQILIAQVDVFHYIQEKYPEEFENRKITVGVNFVEDRDNDLGTHCSLNNLDRVNYFKYLFEQGFEKKYLKSYLYPKHDIADCMMRKINNDVETQNCTYLKKSLTDFLKMYHEIH